MASSAPEAMARAGAHVGFIMFAATLYVAATKSSGVFRICAEILELARYARVR
jgi:hypothetical protein